MAKDRRKEAIFSSLLGLGKKDVEVGQVIAAHS
jgi:hypothetical protein